MESERDRYYTVNLGWRDLRNGTTADGEVIVLPGPSTISGNVTSRIPLKRLELTAGSYSTSGWYSASVSLSKMSYSILVDGGITYSLLADFTTRTGRCIHVPLNQNTTSVPGSLVTVNVSLPILLWRGIVVASSGKPLAGCLITASLIKESDSSERIQCELGTTTGANGRFVMHVVAGNYSLVIGPPVSSPMSALVVDNEAVPASGLFKRYVFVF